MVRFVLQHTVRAEFTLCVYLPQVAPAMNTFMWESPFTEQHLDKLKQLGVEVIDPIAKKLACGDVGNGAMAAPHTIAAVVRAALDRCCSTSEPKLQ